MKNLLLIITLLLLTTLLPAQTDYLIGGKKVYPPSATTRSFGLIKSSPDLFHGTYQTAIPLFNVSSHQLSVDVAMNYSAPGLRIEDMAPWTGQGWNISGVGVIKRIIKDKPDEASGGYFFQRDLLYDEDGGEYTPKETFSLTSTQKNNIANWTYDVEPDRFTIVTPYFTSEFVFGFDASGYIKAYTIPDNNLKIEYSSSNNEITDFTVTDDRGIEYYFGLSSDETRTAVESMEILTTSVVTHTFTEANTAWFLMDIVTPDDLDTLSYYYDTGIKEKQEFALTEEYFKKVDTASVFDSYLDTLFVYREIFEYTTPRLNEIESCVSSASFYSSTQREDIINTSSPYNCQLDSIKLFNVESDLTRIFQFNYSYGGNTGHYSLCRLLLDEIYELGSEGFSLAPYRFEYYKNMAIPGYQNNNFDHWGYYNERSNRDTIFSSLPDEPWDYMPGVRHYSGNVDTYKQGMLHKIYNRNGGYTQIDYDMHDYGYRQYTPEVLDTTRYYPCPVHESASLNSKYEIPEDYYREFTAPVSDGEVSIRLANGMIHEGGFDGDVRIYKVSNQSNVYSGSQFETLDDTLGSSEVYYKNTPFSYSFDVGASYAISIKLPVHKQSAEVNIEFQQNCPDFIITPETDTIKTVRLGGARLSSLSYYPSTEEAPLQLNYTYRTSEDSLLSSGVVNVREHYNSYFYDPLYSGPNLIDSCTYIRVSSRNNRFDYYLTPHQVAYDEVTVINPEAGKSIYKFISPIAYYDTTITDFLSPQVSSVDWKAGYLGSLKVLDESNNIVKTTENLYAYLDDPRDTRVKIPYIDVIKTLGTTTAADATFYEFSNNHSSDWINLSSKRVTVDGLSTISNYYYENPEHKQLTGTETYSDVSDKVHGSFILYPKDYDTNPNSFIDTLVSENILTAPIERVSYLRDSTSGSSLEITSASLNEYYGSPAGKLKRNKAVENTSSSPIAQTAYRFSNMSSAGVLPFGATSPSGYNPDTRYIEQSSVKYNSDGKAVEVKTLNQPTISYLWGYNGSLRVAEIVNAEISDIVSTYTTAEKDTIYKSGNGFESLINDLRSESNLSDALVSSSEYKPGVGITKSTGPNGISSTIEYDDLGRPIIIKDDDGNIIKKYIYNYRQELNLRKKSNTTTSITLVWNRLPNNDTTKVYYRISDTTASYTLSGSTTNNEYTISGLSQSTQYDIKIISQHISGEIIDEIETTSSLSEPSTPTNLSATKNAHTSITLSWTDSYYETYYNIYRSLTSTTDYTHIGTAPQNSQQYIDNTVLPNTRYYYKVKASNQEHASDLSSSVNAITDYPPIGNPSNINTYVDGSINRSVEINWSQVSYTTGYKLYKSSSPTSGYTLVGTYSTTNRTETLYNLDFGQNYYFKVESYNPLYSSMSNYIQVSCNCNDTADRYGFGPPNGWAPNGTTYLNRITCEIWERSFWGWNNITEY